MCLGAGPNKECRVRYTRRSELDRETSIRVLLEMILVKTYALVISSMCDRCFEYPSVYDCRDRFSSVTSICDRCDRFSSTRDCCDRFSSATSICDRCDRFFECYEYSDCCDRFFECYEYCDCCDRFSSATSTKTLVTRVWQVHFYRYSSKPGHTRLRVYIIDFRVS